MKTGLTLGKFAPLHKGHQLVIERALHENDHVIVMVYDAPETTSIPLPVRSGWIKRLYPRVEVIEAWDGPTLVGDTLVIKKMHDEYLLKKLGKRTITHFYSSEFYGEHVSQALGAKDCRVDPDRKTVPVSGTVVRRDPYSVREFLDPVVYRDLIVKVVFLGAPSTGKSTLAESLADTYTTKWMPEYGREYWDQHQQDRRLTPEQLVDLAEGHREREDALVLQANHYLFVDTDATTTHMFSLYYHGDAPPRLRQLAAETLQRYDLFFLCEDDIPYDNTWDRSGKANRTIFQQQIRADLLARRIPFISLFGSLEERQKQVSDVLENYEKFTSIGNCMKVGKHIGPSRI